MMMGLLRNRPRRPSPPTPAAKASPAERPTLRENALQTPGQMGELVSPKQADVEICWRNLHPAMKFRFYGANELPYRNYEEQLLRLEFMPGGGTLKPC